MVKVDIIFGMLGSGKTSLIKQMLDTVYANKKVLVIENEVGQLNLDALELREKKVEVKELTYGCICCTMKLSFMEVLEQLPQMKDLDYIIIEPSGMADIKEFIMVCKQHEGIKINRMIMVANAYKMKKFMAIAGSLFLNQIRCANHIFLNFTHFLDTEQLSEVKKSLWSVNPSAKMVETPLEKISGDDFCEEDCVSPVENLERKVHVKMQARGVKQENLINRCVQFSKDLSYKNMDEIRALLEDVLCEDIYRIKGYIRLEDGAVYKLDHIAGDLYLNKSKINDENIMNKLIIIGRKNNVYWLERKLREY